MHLTPDMLAGCYDYLRTCLPFRRWKLPPSEEIKWHVSAHKDRFGHCDFEGGEHTIAISVKLVGRSDQLLRTMSHEMIHVYLDRIGVKAAHGRDFKRCAALVCRHHGFDEKTF